MQPTDQVRVVGGDAVFALTAARPVNIELETNAYMYLNDIRKDIDADARVVVSVNYFLFRQLNLFEIILMSITN